MDLINQDKAAPHKMLGEELSGTETDSRQKDTSTSLLSTFHQSPTSPLLSTHKVADQDIINAYPTEQDVITPRVCVDNASNCKLGHVGKEVGTHVHHKDGSVTFSTSSTSSSNDNASNRKLGRVGKEVGTHVLHKDGSVTLSSSSSAATTSTSSSKVHADSALNRKLGRVGKKIGTYVQHKDGSVTLSSSSSAATTSTSLSKVYYVDNALNRKLGRVGIKIGTYFQHKDDSVNVTLSDANSQSSDDSQSSNSGSIIKYYVDNAVNRRLRRVGQPIIRRRQRPSKLHKTLVNEACLDEIAIMLRELDFKDPDRVAISRVHEDLQRNEVEEEWEKSGIDPSTDLAKVQEHIKEIIPFNDIAIKKQIGEGGFAKVYAAMWKGSPIAFKELIVQQLTKKIQKRLVQEIKVFSMLEHPNVVKMFGVVLDPRNIGIVMEYVPKTLFHTMFIEEVRFTVIEKMKLLGEVLSAIAYLHSKDIAHCDIKCQNVLLDCDNLAKICDFGISIIKSSTESSSSAGAAAPPGQGTPRYSAPEVLRGELLSLAELKMTDIYSLALVIYEVLVEEEVYENLKLLQLMEHIGNKHLHPTLEGTSIPKPVRELLAECWIKKASSRPLINALVKKWAEVDLKSFQQDDNAMNRRRLGRVGMPLGSCTGEGSYYDE